MENSMIDKALSDAFVAGRSKQSFASFKKEWLKVNKSADADHLEGEILKAERCLLILTVRKCF